MSTNLPILIVDDFEDALEIYREYLTFKGYNIVTASSGADAITVARAARPKLIFMDLRMAHMTGEEALKLLRLDPTFADVPIVAFTAHALDDERRAAIDAGFTELIPKPCLPDELLVAIERLIAATPSPSAPGPTPFN